MRVLDRFDADDIAALHKRGEFFWLDLRDPADDEVSALGRMVDLPPLAVQDTLEFGQRPKLDQYGKRVLIVFYGADAHDLVEVHVHVSGAEVVTVRRAPCAHLTATLESAADGAARSEEELVFRVLDALADSLATHLEHIEAEVAELAQIVFERASMDERRRIGELRSELFRLAQHVVPQRDMLAGNGDVIASLPGMEADGFRHLFRDVHDELVGVANAVDYQRELLSEALTVYLSTVNNRLNETLKQLTLVATIFLPLTFVTGFFGQNFGWMVDHINRLWSFLVYGVGGLVIAVVLLFAYFRRQGYFEREQ